MNQSCHTDGGVIAHKWMSSVMQIDVDEWVMSQITEICNRDQPFKHTETHTNKYITCRSRLCDKRANQNIIVYTKCKSSTHLRPPPGLWKQQLQWKQSGRRHNSHAAQNCRLSRQPQRISPSCGTNGRDFKVGNAFHAETMVLPCLCGVHYACPSSDVLTRLRYQTFPAPTASQSSL